MCPEEHFDAGFLVPLLASLSHRESSSHTDDELEVPTIHVSSAYNCNDVGVTDCLFHNQQRPSVPYNSVSNLDIFGIAANAQHELYENFPPDSMLKSLQNRFKTCAQMIDEEAQNIEKQKLNQQDEQNDHQGFRSSQNYSCVQVIHPSDIEYRFFHLITESINRDTKRYFLETIYK